MIHIRAGDAKAAVADGRPARDRNTKEQIRVIAAPPRYLWRPVRGGIPGILHELPTFLADEAK